MSAPNTRGKVSAIYPCLYAADGRRIFELEHGTTNELQRLAACWNACEGIDTEDLEAGSVSLIHKLHDAAAKQLLAQRDELLEALKLADLTMSGANMNRAVVEKKVLAAIAACQPQPTVAHLPADDTEGGAA